MLSNEENEMLTRVGPGTPAGEMLRRYWWPVGFSEEVKSKGTPVKVRLLGEDFVLFRDGGGELGLLELHCSHRGTSLEFGRVEDNGIRCCYHGWLYDRRGKCLEQPAEPEDSTFKDRIQHPAYHAREAAGLVFAFTMISMAVSELTVIAQVGTTIGLGLLFDTLVVRSLMTPSIAALLGRWFWWPQSVRSRPKPSPWPSPPSPQNFTPV